MRNGRVNQSSFLWALQGACVLHRKPFSPELALQQLAAPYTVGSFLDAASGYGFDAVLNKIKLAAYPFQHYGMMTGTVVHLSADSTDMNKINESSNVTSLKSGTNNAAGQNVMAYKARVRLDEQILVDPQGNKLQITPGMQVVAEINQGKRTVLKCLLSPVQKAVHEAVREM